MVVPVCQDESLLWPCSAQCLSALTVAPRACKSKNPRTSPLKKKKKKSEEKHCVENIALSLLKRCFRTVKVGFSEFCDTFLIGRAKLKPSRRTDREESRYF